MKKPTKGQLEREVLELEIENSWLIRRNNSYSDTNSCLNMSCSHLTEKVGLQKEEINGLKMHIRQNNKLLKLVSVFATFVIAVLLAKLKGYM